MSGLYLVADIKPWRNTPDLLEATEKERLDIATACFHDVHIQNGSRRLLHAALLVSNSLLTGILFINDTTTDQVKVVESFGRDWIIHLKSHETIFAYS